VRLSSRSFRNRLSAALRDEIESLAARPIRDLLDESVVRRSLAACHPAMFDARILAGVAVHVSERVEKRLDREERALDEILGPVVVERVDALLDEDLPEPGALGDILAEVIRQDFARRLFAELIHSAIVSFNKRVNPLFGGLASAVLEDQIRAFIELGMPMLQEQAVAFVRSQANQEFAVELAKALLRGVLAEPLGDLIPQASAGQRRRLASLIVDVVESERFQAGAADAALRIWDDVYARLRDRKLGEVVDTADLARVLAEPLAEVVVRALACSQVAEMFGEMFAERSD